MNDTSQAEDIKITWGEATKLWWWWFWRATFSALGGGFVIGFIQGFILGLLNVELETIAILGTVTGGGFGIFIGIFFLKKFLETKRDIKVTWGETTKLWWWWGWRTILSASVGGGVLGGVEGFILGLLNVEQETIAILGTVTGGGFGIFMAIFFLKRLLETQLNEFYRQH